MFTSHAHSRFNGCFAHYFNSPVIASVINTAVSVQLNANNHKTKILVLIVSYSGREDFRSSVKTTNKTMFKGSPLHAPPIPPNPNPPHPPAPPF